MNQLHKQIIKYLYDNDNGNYIDIRNVFKDEKQVNDMNLQNILSSLVEYIDFKKDNKQIFIEQGMSKLTKDDSYLIRITQYGRDYYENKINIKSNSVMEYKKFIVTVVMMCIALTTLLFAYILPSLAKETKDIPEISVKVINQTDKAVLLDYRNDFIIWLPSIINNGRNLSGKFEFVNTEEEIEIAPKSEKFLKIKILNVNHFYQLFKNGDCDISFYIHASNGKSYFSEDFPFEEKSIGKYYTTINIQ